MVVITKQYRLSGLHRLDEKSRDPLCRAVHGHEYLLRISLQVSDIDRSGLGECRTKLDQIVTEKLLHPLEGQSLHQKLRFSSGEYLAEQFQNELQPFWPDNKLRVSIQETRKNFFSA